MKEQKPIKLLSITDPRYIRRLVREGNKAAQKGGLYWCHYRLSRLTTDGSRLDEYGFGLFGQLFDSTDIIKIFIYHEPGIINFDALKDSNGQCVVASREIRK